MQWLQHSQKKYCELCNYSFVFHKRYTHSMPDGTLPVWLYTRYLLWRGVQLVGYLLRLAFVLFAWLLLVPYTTYRVWCMYFNVGDRVADLVLGTEIFQPPTSSGRGWPAVPITLSPSRLAHAAWNIGERLFDELTEHWLHSVIVTGAVILSFAAVFLLREWVAHNIPEPQAELEDDAPPADDPARDRIRAAALAAAQARAENMLAADPAQMIFDDMARTALAQRDNDAPMPNLPNYAATQQEFANLFPWDAMRNAPVGAQDDDGWEDEEDDTPQDDDWIDESESEGEAPLLPAAPAPPPPPPPPGDEEDEEDEMGWDDPENADHFAEDIEGVLEAIGLHGPLVAFFQTLLLLQALAVSVISIFVAIPYCVGRLLGFRVLDIVLLPVDLLRTVTDPVFEFVLSHLAAPLAPLARLAEPGQAAAAAEASGGLWDALRSTHLGPVARAIQEVAWKAVGLAYGLQAHTRGTALWERALCVALGHGYAFLILAAEAHAGHFLHGTPVSWAQYVLKQYLRVAKVLLFSVIDLLLFPLFCGILLEWCLFPLFPGASFARLAGDFAAAPFTATFCRWTSGTVYMFHFAQFLSAIRSVVRPGVMCWMRDASDPDFHPIKEILETNSLLQLRRIGDSVIMYGAVLVLVLGATLRVLNLVPGLFPLYWHPMQPVLHVPLDLLLVHFGLRLSVKRTRLSQNARKAFKRWWVWAAKCLRLSAFLMGDEQPDEMGTVEGRTWLEALRTYVLQQPGAEHDLRFVHGGGYARVPADDHPAPDAPLVIATDVEGTPIDDEARTALAKQEASIAKMKDKAAYSIVYLPGPLRPRVLVLLVLLWLSSAAVSAVGFVAPLLIGRSLAYVGGMGGMHDVYAVFLGVVVLVLGTLVRHCALELTPRRLAVEEHVAACVRNVSRVAYVLGAYAGLVPLLTGLVLHQYVVPVQNVTTDGVPQLNVLHAWALGVMALHTALLFILMVRPDDYPLLWDVYDFLQHGRIWRVPIRPTARTALLPMLAVLIPSLVLPYLVALGSVAIAGDWDAPAAVHQLHLRYANWSVLLGTLLFALGAIVPHRLDFWTSVLRDELFLESTQLCNYDEQDEKRTHQNYGPLPDRIVRG